MFGNFKESFRLPGRGKTFPQSRENHGPANHQPDAPKVTTRSTREVIFVPDGATHDVQNALAREIFIRDPHQPTTRGKVYFPEVKEPIGDSKGTSKEALQRAKRRIKKGKKKK